MWTLPLSHLIHPQEWSHPCRFESRFCLQSVCPSWSAYTPHTPYQEEKYQPSVHFKKPNLNISAYISCTLTSSWYRRRGRWGTCHTWLRRRLAAYTHRLRTRTAPSRCTGDPGWTCMCLYVWSSCSSRPASLVHTGRSHSYRCHALRINNKQEEDNVTKEIIWGKRGCGGSRWRGSVAAAEMFDFFFLAIKYACYSHKRSPT